MFFYNKIFKIQIKYRLDGGINSFSQWLRLADIVRIVRKFKPESCIEFGSGTSTVMLGALGIKKMTTYEESPYWYDRTKKSLDQISDNLSLILLDTVVELTDEYTVFFNISHSEYADMVYVDGPTSKSREGMDQRFIKDPKGYLPDTDVEKMWENGVYPRIVVIDVRRATVRRLICKANGKYRVHLKSDFYFNTNSYWDGRYLFHTVLERI